jgi:16S rRNA (guanine527-N7)-methyltransferase
MHASFSLNAEQEKKLKMHLALLNTWGKIFNLTAIKHQDDMWNKHVMDALSVAPFMDGDSILDVGTGPGFPGIPLAVFFPEKQVTLLDSNGKKTRFLFQVKTELALANVTIVNARVEDFQVEHPFSTIICRAFSELEKFHTSCTHLADAQTLFMAMKGKIDSDELAQLKPLVQNLQVHDLTQDWGHRHLLIWHS